MLLLALSAPLQAQRKKHSAHKPGHTVTDTAEQRAKSLADLVKATSDYKARLEELLVFEERDVQRATEQLEKYKSLYAIGAIARVTLEEGERARADALAKVDRTRTQMVQADNLIAEAQAAEQLAKSGPLRPGGYDATAVLIRYNGSAAWSLSDTGKIRDFFVTRFGRALPVSAFGQTSVHDTLGFDHHNAIDVALHPDSSEGRALMAYLRQGGISFIAFRSGVPGSATGAHIHIGKPSRRVALVPHSQPIKGEAASLEYSRSVADGHTGN